MAIDATIGGIAADSYVTLDYANAYAEARLPSAVWTAATDVLKEQALKAATRLLDDAFEYVGAKSSLTQKLRWPRIGAYDRDNYYVDSDILPHQLLEATVELAIYLLTRDPSITPELLGTGISQVSVGPLSVTIDKTATPSLIPEHIELRMREFGTPLSQNSRGAHFAKVVRT